MRWRRGKRLLARAATWQQPGVLGGLPLRHVLRWLGLERSLGRHMETVRRLSAGSGLAPAMTNRRG